MIPLRLYMRNFMCYREQTLDFRGIHLACLTGDNGHGKSAILDAITWSLWGRSRVGARRDDELIHLGQTEMDAEFEFELLHHRDQTGNGVRYRVIRKRSARRRGQSGLELQGWDAQEGKFRSLTEPTIVQTQRRIIELLRMDYDTFINSSFLLQGRADEFTTKRPTERKRVLGDIIGLEIYDRYEKLAKESAQEHKTRADQLLAAVEQIERGLEREPEYQADVETAETELAELQAERAATEEAYASIRARLQEAESAQQQLVAIERRITTTREEIRRLDQEQVLHDERLQALETALAKEAEIEAGFKVYQQALADSEAMNARLAESAALKERRSELEQLIAAARHALDKERYSAAEQVRQLETSASALEQQAEWEEIKAALGHLDERMSEKESAQAEVQDLAAEIAAMQADNKRAQEDAAQTKDKIALLSASQEASSEKQAHCPLCNQPLAESNCAQLLATFEVQLEAEREAYRQRNTQINENQRHINELGATIADVDQEGRQRSGWQRREAAVAHVIDQAQQATEALPAAQERLSVIAAKLEEKKYVPEHHAALIQVEHQLGALGYDAQAHRQLQVELVKLRPLELQMQTLREARSGLGTVRLAILQLEQSRSQVKARLQEDQAQAGELDEVVQQIPELQLQALQARQVLETAHDREQRANLRLGAARNKVDYCADLKRQQVKRLEEETQLREKQGIYQELQRAFGKNGVQAMLIEGAIPDIEQEANRLLARMSQGQMHVRFETQRDTKKGDTIETLDIHITDRIGTRSYETYSGGERYRIDFAIRIALSKLLAHRAGAQLQTLVIDEGFGTQDSQGRQGLIDAINAVQDDFACILAITHIEELKDAFNVRIEVNKTDEGSEIIVL